MEECVTSAITFVANHFDTVDKATTAVVGTGLTYAGIWVGKRGCKALASFAGWTYGKAKSRILPPVDTVFARLLSHFDDADAMYTGTRTTTVRDASGKSESVMHAATLETGTLEIRLTGNAGGASHVKDKGYDVYPDLTAAEKKVIDSKVKAKIAEVVERDRLARRANLSAPKHA